MTICCIGPTDTGHFNLVIEDELPAIPQSGPWPDLRGQLFTSNTSAPSLELLFISQFSSTHFRSILIIFILMKSVQVP